MKLKKSLFSNVLNNTIIQKFNGCTRASLKRGDYIRVKFVTFETHKKGGGIFRLNTLTGILLKKKITFTKTTLILSVILRYEKIKWRLQVFSLLFISVTYLKKCYSKKNLYLLT